MINKKYKSKSVIITAVLLLSAAASPMAIAWDRGEVKTAALLPVGSGNAEAFTVDGQGNLYVTTFSGGKIHKFSHSGELIDSVSVVPSSGSLLEIAFHPLNNKLLVVDFGDKKILEVDPDSGEALIFSDFPGSESVGPNVLTFDQFGNVFVSDSFQGIIWKIPSTGGMASIWFQDDLLDTSGFPPFGANGIAFNNDYSSLYVANTGDDTILEITMSTEYQPENIKILTNSVNGPDGIFVDEDNRIYIAENQSNQILILDESGKAIDILGDFNGIDSRGRILGLLMPADIEKFENKIFISNFALDLGLFGLTQSYSNQYATQVRQHSIAEIKYKPKNKEYVSLDKD